MIFDGTRQQLLTPNRNFGKMRFRRCVYVENPIEHGDAKGRLLPCAEIRKGALPHAVLAAQIPPSDSSLSPFHETYAGFSQRLKQGAHDDVIYAPSIV